jgi:hypothetical protein
MSLRQNILLSNANKSVVTNLNNDITLNFPSNLFFKPPSFLELINFDLSCELLLFGNTNNTLIISFINDLGVFKTYTVVVEFSKVITTDYELCQAIKTALNSVSYDNYNISFDVTESSITNVVTNFKVELDASTTAYSITCTKPCTISFNHKDSIGMLIGFGSGVYENVTLISGTSTQSISAYNYIDVYNDSGNNGTFPNYNDYNCKMCLFNSNGTLIPNSVNSNDTTISINSELGLTQYDSIGRLLKIIETAMNVYSSSYSPAANFVIDYNYTTNKVKITNATGAKFGIGFDFDNIGGIITSGSLHFILGFEQKSYINITSIESPKTSLTYENTFSDDYILLCSDLSNNSADLNILGIGNANNIKANDILFAIPYTQSRQFSPVDSSFYKVDISNSPFSIGYKKRSFSDTNPNLVNFYLRTLSGRSIAANCQWTALISFNF